MAGSEVTRIVCAPWAGVQDLPDDRPELPADTWDDLLWQASETLYAFTGGQFSGGCESYAVLDDDPIGGRSCGPAAGSYLSSGYGGYRASPGRGRLLVMLPGAPVTEVLEVLVNGQPITGYGQRLPAGRVWPLNGRPWPGDGSVGFRYRHGRPPPIGGRNSAVQLALEVAKSRTGGRCKLPQRVESITRENVTVSMLNTFQMIDDGKVGLYDVDLWIREVNRDALLTPPTVWSPDIRRATRSVL